KSGSLHVIHGPTNTGKTELLNSTLGRVLISPDKEFLCFSVADDFKDIKLYPKIIFNPGELGIDAIEVFEEEQISFVINKNPDVRVIGIDNVHLFDKKGEDKNLSKITSFLSIVLNINSNGRVIGIDNVHLFDKKGEDKNLSKITSLCMELVEKGYRVIVTGTEVDYKGNVSSSLSKLISLSDNERKILGVCPICEKENATRSQLFDDGSFSARCEEHWNPNKVCKSEQK
ncbi:hypothetical protein ACFL15_02265, partial [Patescibacteria group bacterium]